MGRAARRAQERAERRQRRQQVAPRRPTVSAPTTTTETVARGSFLRPRWVIDILSELRRVTWPTRQETAHLTMVVIIVAILFGIVLGSADLGFSWLIEHTILR